jgi:hypothetical protein
MTDEVEFAHVLDEPALYRVLSSSSTVYYVDTRDLTQRRYMRARGEGNTLHSGMDNNWQPLVSLEAGPVVWRDGEYLYDRSVVWRAGDPWLLRVGSEHKYESRRLGGPPQLGGVYWVVSRAVERIDVLFEMPDEGERTINERLAFP